MRDPWFPIAILLIALLGVWLSIFGPLPDGVVGWLHDWQTLVAATVASIAAYIAFQNTSRSLTHNEELERRRRSRKHAALRAMLPLALSAVTDYAERSARALDGLLPKCVDGALPKGLASKDLAQPLPSDALRALADFIEYSDDVDVSILEATVAWVQIHDSRIRGLVKDNHDPLGSTLVLAVGIEGSIIDSASIYGGASRVYDYARRRSDQIPNSLSWDEVIGALQNLRFWDGQYPRLYAIIAGRAGNSNGPFDRLSERTS